MDEKLAQFQEEIIYRLEKEQADAKELIEESRLR